MQIHIKFSSVLQNKHVLTYLHLFRMDYRYNKKKNLLNAYLLSYSYDKSFPCNHLWNKMEVKKSNDITCVLNSIQYKVIWWSISKNWKKKGVLLQPHS